MVICSGESFSRPAAIASSSPFSERIKAVSSGRSTASAFFPSLQSRAFIRRSAEYQDVLVVLNLRGETVVRDLSQVGGSLTLAAVLGTTEEPITCEGSTLTLPGYSVAVLTL